LVRRGINQAVLEEQDKDGFTNPAPSLVRRGIKWKNLKRHYGSERQKNETHMG